jgi:hypothetical protein
VIVLGFAVGTFAGQTAGAAALLAAKVFAAIQSDQVPAITNVDEGSVLLISNLEGWRSVPLRAMLSKIAG